MPGAPPPGQRLVAALRSQHGQADGNGRPLAVHCPGRAHNPGQVAHVVDVPAPTAAQLDQRGAEPRRQGGGTLAVLGIDEDPRLLEQPPALQPSAGVDHGCRRQPEIFKERQGGGPVGREREAGRALVVGSLNVEIGPYRDHGGGVTRSTSAMGRLGGKGAAGDVDVEEIRLGADVPGGRIEVVGAEEAATRSGQRDHG